MLSTAKSVRWLVNRVRQMQCVSLRCFSYDCGTITSTLPRSGRSASARASHETVSHTSHAGALLRPPQHLNAFFLLSATNQYRVELMPRRRNRVVVVLCVGCVLGWRGLSYAKARTHRRHLCACIFCVRMRRDFAKPAFFVGTPFNSSVRSRAACTRSTRLTAALAPL